MSLIVMYKPENTSLNTNANERATLENSNVTFVCTSEGNPSPQYRFYYINTYLGNSSSGTFQTQVTKSGLYFCVPFNKVGEGQNASVHINVVVPPAVHLPSDHVVVEGNKVSIFCNVTGDPPLSIEWTKVNESEVLSNTSSLTLYNVTRPGNPNETVQYQCTARNAYGDASAVVTVHVYYEPENISWQTNSAVFLKGQDNVTFFFSAQSRPQECNASLIEHKHGGRVLVTSSRTCDGSSSILHNMSTDDLQGGIHVYSCLPRNRIGSGQETFVNIIVEVPARVITASAEDDEVVEDSIAYLFCEVEGYPPPVVTWIGPDGTVIQNGTMVNFTVHRNDTGAYQCNATNPLRSDSKIVELNVLYKPEKTKCQTLNNSNKFEKGKENVTIYFSAESRPQECNASLVEGESMERGHLINGACNGSLTKLTTVLTDNLSCGVHTYTCSAENRAGRGKGASVNITIQEPAKVISTSALNYEVFEGTATFLHCTVEGCPTPNVTWFAPDGSVIQDGIFDTNVEVEVSGDGTATYQCKATNALGSDTKSVKLNISLFTDKDTKYTGQFTIGGIVFTNELADEKSLASIKFKNRVRTELLKLFEGQEQRPLSIVISLRCGSIIVDFTMFFRGLVNKTTAIGPLEEALKTGKLGSFDVNTASLIISTTSPYCSSPSPSSSSPTEESNKCSSDAIVMGLAALVAVQFVVIILLIGYICWLRRRGKPQQYETYQLTEKKSFRNIHVNEGIVDETDDESFIQDSARQPGAQVAVVSNYASLDEARRSPEVEILPQVNVYGSLAAQTRSWEVPRESLKVDKIIGKGAFGQVAKATVANLRGCPSEKTVAVKMLKGNALASDRKDLLSELEIMKTLPAHPHVITLLGCVTSAENLMVIIEYVPYGDLLGYLRKSRGLNDTYYKDPDVKSKSSLTSQQLMKFAWQVADGMSFLSSNKIVHRDLAARNILVGERETCKVTDFGMARDVHQEDIYQKKTKGRLPVKWTAYEALLYGMYSTKSDVWSYGVVLFEIFTIGGCPYPKIDRRKLAELLHQDYRMPKPAHVDDELYAIMLECWQQCADLRPSFESLRNRMRNLEKRNKRLIDLKKYDKKLYDNVEDLFA